jgi:hypothetical protein
MTKHEIIEKIGYLFWWTANKEQLSEEAIVEAVLCYGDEKELESLFAWLGMDRVAAIFRQQLQHKRVNYPARTRHFFSLFFNKHVS